MKLLALIFVFSIMVSTAFGQDGGLLLDDFEDSILGGPYGTVDFGVGGGSSVEVTADTNIKHSGSQSLKVTYDAISGGYMWIAKGIDLDANNAAWLVEPQDIDWMKYRTFSFWMYGSDSKTKIAFDIKDNGGEFWRFMVEDNFQGWEQISCPLVEFSVRSDWQSDSALTNDVLDFPIKSFQFEPRPEAKGTLYFDTVELLSR